MRFWDGYKGSSFVELLAIEHPHLTPDVQRWFDELRQLPPTAHGTTCVALRFAGDAFVTVEVQGDLTGPEAERYGIVAPRFVPFAYSNPIFVDADGDGRWTPKGLVAPLPATIRDPLGP